MRTQGILSGTTFVALAAAVALTSSGASAAGALITGRQIANGTVTSADLRDVGSVDLRDGAVAGRDVRDGSLGAGDISATVRERLRGPVGPPGPVGPSGLSGLQLLSGSVLVPPLSNGFTSLRCPPGTVVLSVAGSFPPGVQTSISAGDATGHAFGHNETRNNFELGIDVLCAVVAPEPRP